MDSNTASSPDTKPSEKPAKKPRNVGKPFHPGDALRAAKRTAARAAGIADPVVVGDLARVEAFDGAIRSATGALWFSVGVASRASDAFDQAKVALNLAAAPVFGVLRVTEDGRAFVRTLQRRGQVDLMSAVSGSGFRVPKELLEAIEKAQAVATDAQSQLTSAEAAKADAIDEYVTAKVQLEAAISSLKAALVRHHANARIAERIAYRQRRMGRRTSANTQQPSSTQPG